MLKVALEINTKVESNITTPNAHPHPKVSPLEPKVVLSSNLPNKAYVRIEVFLK